MPNKTEQESPETEVAKALRTVMAQFAELKQAIITQDRYIRHIHQAIQAYDNKFGTNHDQMITEMVGKNKSNIKVK